MWRVSFQLLLSKRLYDHNLRPINHNPKKLEQTQNLKLTFEETLIFSFFGKSF